MSTAQHTPGQWEVLPLEHGATYLRIRGTRLGARFKIANVHAPKDTFPGDVIESVANARLIAVAPELLAALEESIEREHNPFEPDNQSVRYGRLIALRAKATGSAS